MGIIDFLISLDSGFKFTQNGNFAFLYFLQQLALFKLNKITQVQVSRMWDQKQMKTICQIILSVHMATKTLLILFPSKIKLLCRQCRVVLLTIPCWGCC